MASVIPKKALINLKQIEVTDNKLAGGELKNLVKFQNLRTIKFGANNVKDLSELAVLKELKTLKNLDFGDNPVTQVEGYREKVFEMFPDLDVLDNYTKDGEEYISEDEEDEDYGDEEEGEAPEGAAEEGEDDLDEEAEYGDEEGEDDYGDDDDYGQDDDDESAELGKRKK